MRERAKEERARAQETNLSLSLSDGQELRDNEYFHVTRRNEIYIHADISLAAGQLEQV